MSKNCVFSPSRQFLDIFQIIFRHFSDIFSTSTFAGLSELLLLLLQVAVSELDVLLGVLSDEIESELG